MATDEIQLKAQERADKSNAVRMAQQVPGVLYGHGIKNKAIQVDAKLFGKAYRASGQTSLVSLDLQGEEHNVLIKEVQMHPVKNNVIHVDFYQVKMDEKVKARVELSFTGEAPAVKDKGGVFIRNIDALEVEALPKDLPRELAVDITNLQEYGEVFRIADLRLPEGVEVTADSDTTICLVQAPRTEEELEQLEEEVAEDVEAVEGVTKDEDAEGEEGEEGTDDKPEEGETKPEEPAGE